MIAKLYNYPANKYLVIICLTLLVSSAFVSCDDKTVACGEILVEVGTAAQDWNTSTASCEAYADAMHRYLDNDCATPSVIDEYESILDTLNCP